MTNDLQITIADQNVEHLIQKLHSNPNAKGIACNFEKDKIKGSQIITLNALRHEEHLSHFSLAEARELVKELQIPNAYFTHISHQLGLHSEVSKLLPPGMELAYDGLSFEI